MKKFKDIKSWIAVGLPIKNILVRKTSIMCKVKFNLHGVLVHHKPYILGRIINIWWEWEGREMAKFVESYSEHSCTYRKQNISKMHPWTIVKSMVKDRYTAQYVLLIHTNNSSLQEVDRNFETTKTNICNTQVIGFLPNFLIGIKTCLGKSVCF